MYTEKRLNNMEDQKILLKEINKFYRQRRKLCFGGFSKDTFLNIVP